MNNLRLIVYDKLTGNRLYDCMYIEPFAEPSLEQLHKSVEELNQLNIESIGLIRYEKGEYEKDFLECGARFRIDLDTLKPLFTYPNPNDPEKPQEFVKPLSESINENTEYLIDVDFRLSMIELGLN